MVSVIILSIVMLSVIMLSVIVLSVIVLSVIMLSVIMLNVIMLSVIAPLWCVYTNKLRSHKPWILQQVLIRLCTSLGPLGN